MFQIVAFVGWQVLVLEFSAKEVKNDWPPEFPRVTVIVHAIADECSTYPVFLLYDHERKSELFDDRIACRV